MNRVRFRVRVRARVGVRVRVRVRRVMASMNAEFKSRSGFLFYLTRPCESLVIIMARYE